MTRQPFHTSLRHSCRSIARAHNRGSLQATVSLSKRTTMKRCGVSSALPRLIQAAPMPGHCVGMKRSRWRNLNEPLHSSAPLLGRNRGIIMLGTLDLDFADTRYGMGLVYLKTGKLKYAEHHFRRAAEINPTNAVLLCCIGMVRHYLFWADHRCWSNWITLILHCGSTTKPSNTLQTARWLNSNESESWSTSAELM